MKKGVWVLLMACAGCWAVPPPPPVAEVGFMVTGYHVWWMGQQWEEADLRLLDRLFVFEIRIGADGEVTDDHGWPETWRPLIERAQEHDVPVLPTLTLASEPAFDSLFASSEAIDALIATSRNLVAAGHADGLHIDFEVYDEVSPEARAGFVHYLRRVKVHLLQDDPRSELIVFLPAFDHPEVFDEVAIAQIADYVVVQGYDVHWATGDHAGPVAPLRGWGTINWETIRMRYGQMGIPAEKLIMAVPYYGYEWPTASGEPGAATEGRGFTIPYAPAYVPRGEGAGKGATELMEEHEILRDSLSGSPYYAVYKDGSWRQGWFEDEESLRMKYQYIRNENLAGIAIFALGYDEGLLRPALFP